MPTAWKRGHVPRGVDPLVHWRMIEMADTLPRLHGEPRWWSVLIELEDTSLAHFLERLQGGTDIDLGTVLHVPELYRAQASRHRQRQTVTLYATRPFFELIFERQDLGVGRVLLGRLLPELLRNFDAGSERPQPKSGPKARAIVAVIDDGIAFAHELFRRADGGSRVEYAWLHDGTPPNMPRGRELDRTEIEALLALHSHGQWLDEEGFYRDAGLIDFANGLHKTAAFRRAHGTHVAALAGGHPPGAADDDFPLILVQLAADTVGDTSGDRIEPELGAVITYILDRADAIAVARGMGDALPLVINFSFGNYAGAHDGTDVIDTALDQALDDVQRPVRVVLPAGNNNLVRCHAVLDFADGAPCKTVHWRVPPDDKTCSYVEIWLPHRGTNPPDLVSVEVTTPDGQASAAVTAAPGSLQHLSWGNAVVGRLDYAFVPFPTERGFIRVAIRPTAADNSQELAPCGLWRIKVTNTALAAGETVHLRIQRNDSLPDYPVRGRQSYFDEPCYRRFDAVGRPLAEDPPGPPCPVTRSGTLNAFACGTESIVVAGYVRGSGEPAAFSAAGPVTPTRDAPLAGRDGPDALGASDDSTVVAGVLSAGSRCGSMVAMSGTSVAAPQAARWLADELGAGRPGDRTAIRQKAAADEQDGHWPGPPPDEARGGGGRLDLPPQPGRPRRFVPSRP